MTVLANNPFALLGEDEPVVAVLEVKKPQVAEKTEKSVAKSAAKPLKKTNKPFNKESRPPRESGPFEGAPEHKEKTEKTERVKPPRRREFDRHSAAPHTKSGSKKEVSRLGDAIVSQDVDGNTVETVAEPEVAELNADGEAIVEPVEAVEPEPEYKTLDQFFAEKQPTKKPTVQLRKANEGADDSQWQNVTLLKKAEEVPLFAGSSTDKQRKTKERVQKTQVVIEQKFIQPPREERSDRPRDGAKPRGRGGPRDSGRDNRNQGKDGKDFKGKRDNREGAGRGAPNVNVTDTNAFPSL